MKTLFLKSLKIENFKGCKKREIQFGSVTDIYGDNGTGKTTIADALTWLLFDRDSSGSTKFGVRPRNADKSLVNYVEIIVEGEFEVDGSQLSLKKVQKQNWVKKRGTGTQELQGNKNEYEINGFPAKEKEFKEKVSEIIDDTTFRIVTDPRAFASLDWKEKRKIIMQLVSEVTDEDVLKSGDFSAIADDLAMAPADKCLDKYKKSLLKLKKDQQEIPTRIDEASRSIVEVDVANLELQKNALNEKLEAVRKDREDFSGKYKRVSELNAEIMKIKLDMGDLERKHNSDYQQQVRAARQEYDSAVSRIYDLESQKTLSESTVFSRQGTLEGLKAELSDLGKKWSETKHMSINPSDTVCDKCGQEYPEDKKEEILQDFSRRKEQRLEEINAKGNAVKERIKNVEKDIVSFEEKLKKISGNLEAAKREAEEKKSAMESIKQPVPVEDFPEYIELEKKLQDLNTELGSIDDGESYRQQLEIQERGIKEELAAVEKNLALDHVNEKLRDRILDLNKELKDVSQKIADCEAKILLLEKFTVQKMTMLSARVDEKFSFVKINMFNTQINGGMSETCDITVDGVNYSDLNNAKKIQAGLDVIYALQQFYQIKAPIFIDNRESVTSIPENGTQIINMFVSKEDKELRIETRGK